jgi:hypothetical protein
MAVQSLTLGGGKNSEVRRRKFVRFLVNIECSQTGHRVLPDLWGQCMVGSGDAVSKPIKRFGIHLLQTCVLSTQSKGNLPA